MNRIHPDLPLDQAPDRPDEACASWRERVSAHWPQKLALLLTVPIIFKALYVACQHAPHLVPRQWSLTWIDRTVPFDPDWTWTYLSIYLLLPVAPFLTTDRARLAAYIRGTALMSAVAFAFFYFLPVELPRPGDPTHHPAYAALVAIDRPVNCFPSMHVGFSVFALLHIRRLRRSEWPEMPAHWLGLGWAWVAAIVVSTLVTKQHYFFDLPAGAALAWACDALGHRSFRRWPMWLRRNPSGRRLHLVPFPGTDNSQENHLPSPPRPV